MNLVVTVANALARLVFAAALLHAVPVFAQSSGDAFPNKSITIYVADFDLASTTSSALSRAAANRAAAPNASVPANSASTASAPPPGNAAAPPPAAADAPNSSQKTTPAADGRPDAPPKPDGNAPDATATDGAKTDGTNTPATDATNTTTGTETAPAGTNPTGTPPAGTPTPAANAAATNTAGNNAAGNNAAPLSATPSSAAESNSTASRTTARKPDAPSDDPRVRAAKFIDLTATTFVKALEHAGYDVKRIRGSAAPESGIIVRGVFAQVDANAGLRRAVYGGTVTDPAMLLFVGVGNLAKPQQTLYQVVTPAPSGALGPVIAVSAYAPISRYELDHDPSEDSLKHTAEQFANDLTRLLNANPLALGQP